MTPESYTRESLLADWQAIGPSQPLTGELQTLLLLYINRTGSASAHGTTDINQQVYPTARYGPIPPIQSSAPPPQRFQRRARNHHSTPAGPCKPIEEWTWTTINAPSYLESGKGKDSWQLAVPTGPTNDCSQSTFGRDLDPVFENIHKV
jgi:hypothetical protein